MGFGHMFASTYKQLTATFSQELPPSQFICTTWVYMAHYAGWASIIEPVTLDITLARENPASLSKVAYSDSVRSRPGDSTSIIKSIIRH